MSGYKKKATGTIIRSTRDDNARIDKEVWDTTGRMSKLRKQYSKAPGWTSWI